LNNENEAGLISQLRIDKTVDAVIRVPMVVEQSVPVVVLAQK
jgi:hypothetical protein